MKLSKKPLVKMGSGIILGGLAGIGVSYLYSHFGATWGMVAGSVMSLGGEK